MENEVKIGDKLVKGYNLIKAGNWEGTYVFLEAVAQLYLVDEIDDIIYGNYLNFVAKMDMTSNNLEPDQWLKLFVLDARYGQLLIQPGDFLENLCNKLNEIQVPNDQAVLQQMLDGGIGKIKWADGAYFTILFDHNKNIQYLVKIHDNEMEPIDFDVEDFRMNRLAKRIEFKYLRGYKQVFSENYDGSDKRGIERTELYPENM